MDGPWWHERYDRFVVQEAPELDESYDPERFLEERLTRVIELCRVSSLGRDTEHPDLGTSSALGKRIRSNYFHVLNAFRSHSERFDRGWDLPEWTRSTDVPGTAGKEVARWSAEEWIGSDVVAVRTALATHLSLLDAASGDLSRKERKALNRSLFLVGSEAGAIYNVITRIYTATRAERRSWEAEE